MGKFLDGFKRIGTSFKAWQKLHEVHTEDVDTDYYYLLETFFYGTLGANEEKTYETVIQIEILFRLWELEMLIVDLAEAWDFE